MKKFETSIGKYNVSITFTKQKSGKNFVFNIIPSFRICHTKYREWTDFELCFEWFLYCVSIVFDNFED